MTEPDSTVRAVARSGLSRVVLAAVLALALVAAVAWLVLEVREYRDADTDAPGAEEREAVIATTTDYIDALWNYSRKDLGKDKLMGSVREDTEALVTSGFTLKTAQGLELDLDKWMTAINAQVASGKVRKSETTVRQIGVERLGEDSAEVVLYTSSVATGKKGQHGNPVIGLWQVDLQKVDGDWKVDQQAPFEGVTQ